jgi:CBS domain containing-hemolysin-like protein
MSNSTLLLVALLLLLLNAFFVGAEFGVISARRSQVEPLAAGRRSARTVLWAMEHLPLMLAAAQLGITVCSLGLGAVAEPALAHLLEVPFADARIPEGLLHPVAFSLALAIVVSTHVVIGEMVPKNLALAGPERAALALTPPLVAFARAFAPLIRALTAGAYVLLRLIGVQPKGELTSAFTAQEVRSILMESNREGLLLEEHGLLASALEFSERVAGDVMVPRSELVTVPQSSTPEQVERLVARTGYSRLPVAAEDGELIGYLHLKDLLYAEAEQYDRPIPQARVRTLASVASSDEVEDALGVMQRAGSHLARVVGEDGATVGLIFLEDVLEQLVGEVIDASQREGTA